MGVVLFWLLLVWHVYTPLHELLHVFACWVTGGTVESLALKPRYGAYLLMKIFPFVVPESDYAGQLTGFSVPNYWAYAFVDFLPYVLSLFGILLLDRATRSRSALSFSMGLVLATAPVFGLPGDYYEAASLIFTQVGEGLRPDWPVGALIHDDVLLLISELSSAGDLSALHLLLIAAGLLTAAYAVLLTLALQVRMKNHWAKNR